MPKRRDFYMFTGVPMETKVIIQILKMHLGTTKTGVLKTVVDEYWQRHKGEHIEHLTGEIRTLLQVADKSIVQYLVDQEEHRHERKTQ